MMPALSPRLRLVLRGLYYLAILLALIGLAGRNLDAGGFVYQGF